MVQKCQEPESAYEAKRLWKTFDSAGPLQCCAKVCISLDTFPPQYIYFKHNPINRVPAVSTFPALPPFLVRWMKLAWILIWGEMERKRRWIDRSRSAEIKDEERGRGWRQKKSIKRKHKGWQKKVDKKQIDGSATLMMTPPPRSLVIWLRSLMSLV